MASSGGNDSNAAQWFWSFLAAAVVVACIWFGLFTSPNIGSRVVGIAVAIGFVLVAVIMWVDAALDMSWFDGMRRDTDEVFRLRSMNPVSESVSAGDELERSMDMPHARMHMPHVPQPEHHLDLRLDLEEDADS